MHSEKNGRLGYFLERVRGVRVCILYPGTCDRMKVKNADGDETIYGPWDLGFELHE